MLVVGQDTLARRALESLRQKLTLRVVLVRRLAKSSWVTVKKSYTHKPLAIVHSAAEYCDPA